MRRFSLWCSLIFSSNNSAETGNSLFYYSFLTGPWRPGQFAAVDFSSRCVKLTPISVIMSSCKLITLTLFASAPADCQADDGPLPTFQIPVNTTGISQTVVKTHTTVP